MTRTTKNYCFHVGGLAINRKTGESHLIQGISQTIHGDMLKFDMNSTQNYKADEFMTPDEAVEYYKKQIETLEDYQVERKSSHYFKKLLYEAEIKLQIAQKREIVVRNEIAHLLDEISYLEGVVK